MSENGLHRRYDIVEMALRADGGPFFPENRFLNEKWLSWQILGSY